MANHDRVGPAGVKRVVFKELAEGDYRKFEAQSNDAETGGGARDLRFRPYDEFQVVFRALFPGVRKVRRRRNGQQSEIEIFVGRLHWSVGGISSSDEAVFEPPTDARPHEGRIPVVHRYKPLQDLPPQGSKKVVLLLIQRSDDTVWLELVPEDSLRSGDWEDRVAGPILDSLDAKRPANQVARGFVDLVARRNYSDA